MFGRWLRAPERPPEGAEELRSVVRQNLGSADEDTVRVVTALAGLVGVVAYADRDYSELEERQLRSELARIHGMTAAGIEAICAVLRRHILEVATVQLPRYARELVALADRELRFDILQVLVDVAASDGNITHAETNMLRTVTTALGLDQRDYNAAQARHREKLSALKS